MSEPSTLQLQSIRELVELIRGGDDTAQSKLVNQIQSYVALTADKNLAQNLRARLGSSDIAQRTLIKMVDGIEQFRGDSTKEFMGWVNQIIKNEVRKAYRDLTRDKRDYRRDQFIAAADQDSSKKWDLPDQGLTPGSKTLAKERVELFHQALQKLPEDYATVIRLRNLEQLPFAEIAQTMERSRDAVTQLWNRAVVKFEKEIKQIME